MNIDKIDKWFDDPDNVAKAKAWFAKSEEKERIRLERANKLLERYGVCDDATFDDLMLEILDKQTISDKRHYNSYTERPLNITNLIWKLAQERGTVVEPLDDFTENFPSSVYDYYGYQFSITHGQGSVLGIYRQGELRYRS